MPPLRQITLTIAMLAALATSLSGGSALRSSASEAASPQAHLKPTPNPVFSSVITALENGTSAPIWLPTTVAANGQTLFASTYNLSTSGYAILLATTADCDGSSVCRFGHVEGFQANFPPTGTAVTLPNGLTAYYTPATCGANCNDSTMSIDVNGFRYVVGEKGANEPDLITMANSLSSLI
jgi:hypothetical protein